MTSAPALCALRLKDLFLFVRLYCEAVDSILFEMEEATDDIQALTAAVIIAQNSNSRANVIITLLFALFRSLQVRRRRRVIRRLRPYNTAEMHLSIGNGHGL